MKHNSDSPRALAACAAVSHSFSEPALEVLWETMEGLSPLFAILRKSVEIISGQGSIWKMTFILSAPIDDQEWGRFVRYAQLVRVYVNRGDNIDGLSSGALMAKTRGEPLLPRLQDLTWVRPIKHSSSLPLFLSPNLHSLYLDLSHDLNIERLQRGDDEQGPDYGKYAGGVTLQSVVSRASHIQDLTVHDATSPFSLETIGTFQHLRILKLHLVSDLLSLSSCLKPLVTLETLTIGMKHDAIGDRLDNMPLDAAPLSLEELRSLQLIGPPKFVVAFLDHVRSPVLQRLDISTACDNVIWRRCMGITSSLFSNTLLSLDVWLHDTPTDTSVRKFRDLFSPLYPLRTLQKLNIKEFKQLECLITPEDISDIAKAWPDLRFLVLPWSKPEGRARPPMLPITALDSIARTCLSLKTLVLPLPDPSPLSDSELPSGFQYINNVTELQLRGGKWKRKARDQCTRYLTHIFPRLQSEGIWLDADYEAIFSWHRR
ncbi:hypothetical protein GSI_08987 [Ganoderma sinense ZZ0214-1]|uniref:F-box domain-containing protein n=1 Tax=Ganoderma sinense ZZ0214-1 TaxID=1077348 RepID=A0A2G8S595_9APHY|nr:hypothetical protein GSI_08987 [Ganoderma sinense ZZ0214-1]